jgi:DNA repair protein RadC
MKSMNMNARLSICQWSAEDQPRTKLLTKGCSTLTDAELLSIIIGSGSRSESAVDLSRRVLSAAGGSLAALAKMQPHDFTAFEGLGASKSAAIMAAMELGRRRQSSLAMEKQQISSSTDVYRIFLPMLEDKHIEEFWAMYLNQSGKVVKLQRISTGGIDGTYADVRIILRCALLCEATQLAVVHNHPSGNPRPSTQDIRLTKSIKDAAETMNIRFFDHVIVTEGKYYSFADEGML